MSHMSKSCDLKRLKREERLGWQRISNDLISFTEKYDYKEEFNNAHSKSQII